MPADNEQDPLDRWLNQQVRPLPPPPGTFELITRRARRRKLRRAAVSVASAAAVAAAVAFAVPVGLSLHLTPQSKGASLAAGNSPDVRGGSASTLGTGTKMAANGEPGGTGSAAGSSTPGVTTPGYLPPNFQPYSVTWDSLSTGWIMGPAGTPGHCGAQQDSAICTSIARTDDGGNTWHGLPAPPVGGPDSVTGVTGLRFLNASYGWAFGPELWATDDGGEHWHQVNTGNAAVTDLETVNGRAYALFGQCSAAGGDKIAECSSYTLKTVTAGSDAWTPVAGVPAGLTVQESTAAGSTTTGSTATGSTATGSTATGSTATGSTATGSTATGSTATGSTITGTTAVDGSAVIELAGAAGSVPATGYLAAPDGTLYAGPLDGSAWHRVAALPCSPGAAADSGLPRQLMLAPDGIVPGGHARLAVVCAVPSPDSTVVYLSDDGGANWAEQTGVGLAGTSLIGEPQSLTDLTDGTLILATVDSASAPGGIYLLKPGAAKWQAATLSDPSATVPGFTYVGMTELQQGVALSGDPSLHQIWMTTDGGQTWQAMPIQD